MTPAEIMRELARDDIFPKDAMAAASADREVMLPVFLDMIDRLVSRQIASGHGNDVMALIPVFHLLGEWQDPRAYRPVVRLMRLPTETIEYLLGDAITETGFRVVAGTYDGDLQPIFEAILDDEADEYARSSMMSALVLITQLHPSQRPDIENFVREFHKHCAKVPADLVIGWMETVAELGLEDMSVAVRDVFDNHLIPDDYCDFSHFEADLQAALDRGGEPDNGPHQKSLITNAIEELSKWHCYSDEFLAEQKIHKVSNDLRVAPWTEALPRAPAKPGRNDPCPCGSGKKFKKCCLQ